LRKDCNIWKVIADLKKVASLPLSRLFPGNTKVRLQPIPELNAKIEYYEARGARVIELSQRGRSPAAIARQVFRGPMWVELITGGHLSHLNLVCSYLRDQPHLIAPNPT
jgi:hypothetical protein